MSEFGSVEDEDRERVRLQASAVVAHKVSKEAATQLVKRAEFRLTMRELLIVVVLGLALFGVVAYYRHQHSQDQQSLNARRSANSQRIGDLENQLTDQARQVSTLQSLVEQLRNALLHLGVNPNSIPSIPADPPAFPTTPSRSASASAGADGGAVSDARPNPSASTTPSRRQGPPSSTPSSTPTSQPTSLPTVTSSRPVIVISLPTPLPAITRVPH